MVPLKRRKLLDRWLADRTLPIEIEIGYGNSKLLYELARSAPSTYFVGVDRNRAWFRRVLRLTLNEPSLPNLLYLEAEGKQFLIESIPSARIQRVHLYFPTPLPKEDRIFSRQFIDEVYRVLIWGGELRVITDVRDYYLHIAELLDEVGWRHTRWTALGIPVPQGLLVGTPCEVEYGSQYVLHAVKAR